MLSLNALSRTAGGLFHMITAVDGDSGGLWRLHDVRGPDREPGMHKAPYAEFWCMLEWRMGSGVVREADQADKNGAESTGLTHTSR